MKKLLISAIAVLALSAQGASAQSAPAIGVVNVAKIMQDSKAASSVRNQLQSKQKSFQSELDGKEKALLAEDQNLVKEKDKASKEEFEKKVKAFREKASSTQREVAQKKAQLDKAFATALEEVQKNVLDVTKQVATEKKLSLVVSSSQVLYSDSSFDITDEVLKRLDSKLPSVSVKF
jgi:outer membrane protein